MYVVISVGTVVIVDAPALPTAPNKSKGNFASDYVSRYVLRFFIMRLYNDGLPTLWGRANLSKRTDNNNKNVRHYGRFVLPLGKAPMQNEVPGTLVCSGCLVNATISIGLVPLRSFEIVLLTIH
jgi:hypothetical protein